MIAICGIIILMKKREKKNELFHVFSIISFKLHYLQDFPRKSWMIYSTKQVSYVDVQSSIHITLHQTADE